MLVTLSGIVTLVKLVQLENDQSPMLVTLLPITTLVKLLQPSNACSLFAVHYASLRIVLHRGSWYAIQRNGRSHRRAYHHANNRARQHIQPAFRLYASPIFVHTLFFSPITIYLFCFLSAFFLLHKNHFALTIGQSGFSRCYFLSAK